jgi:hypothetical protein
VPLTHEDGEQFVLRSLDRAIGLEKGKTDKKARGDVQDDLAHNIRWITGVVLDGGLVESRGVKKAFTYPESSN